LHPKEPFTGSRTSRRGLTAVKGSGRPRVPGTEGVAAESCLGSEDKTSGWFQAVFGLTGQL